MSATKRIVFTLFFLFSWILTACGSMDVEKVESTLACDVENCTIKVTSDFDEDVTIAVVLSVENEGTAIGERTTNGEAKTHAEWQVSFSNFFYSEAVIQSGETLEFVVEFDEVEGQSLFKLETWIRSDGNKNAASFDIYDLVDFSDPDTFIENELSCMDGKIVATTTITPQAEDPFNQIMTMAVYADMNLENGEAISTFEVLSGDSQTIEIPIPEGAELIMLDN
jgi:hypothetical protein